MASDRDETARPLALLVPQAPPGRMGELEDELAATRALLERMEQAARALHRDRDSLRADNDRLRAIIAQRRSERLITLAVCGVVLAGLAGGAWFLVTGDVPSLTDRETRTGSAPRYGRGVIHERDVALRAAPDTGAPSLAVLAEGTEVIVRRTLWHNLQQWVEIEVGGRTGYVLSTEANLS